jgi:hypothetical protein
MTADRPQIRTERHVQASALTTAVLPQPGHRPFRARDAERPEAALSAMPGNPGSLLPSPIALPGPSPAARRQTAVGHIMPGSARHTRAPAKSVTPRITADIACRATSALSPSVRSARSDKDRRGPHDPARAATASDPIGPADRVRPPNDGTCPVKAS